MPNTTISAKPGGVPLSRRRLLLASLAASLPLSARADEPKVKPEVLPAEQIAPIQARLKAAKLQGVRFSQTEHYLGVGDAPAPFRDQALKICQALSVVYQKHFSDKGFTVKFPDHRLSVITLKDVSSYAAFLGNKPDTNIGGHYDLDTNWLVMFDFRGEGQDTAASPERLNTFTLIHEALHQLTFNTGLLERKADVPRCISEGLAMYGELWQPKNRRATLGQTNTPRLQVIAQIPILEDAWLPIERLVTEDRLFDARATQQLAYAESWALVHYSLKIPTGAAKFRAYLKEIEARRSPDQRVKDAKAHFGDLTRLDTEIRHHVSRMI